jgi:ligand-binding SRPBCC domain-containing protein
MARTYRLERRQLVERPLDEVFAFFADATNLQAITPTFLRFSIRTPLPIAMRQGARIEYALSLFGLPLRWLTLISVWEEGRRFVDEQVSGPYALWRHTHTFEPVEGGTMVTDVVEYALPFGILGRLARGLFVRRTLDRIFAHRHEAIARLLPRDATLAPRPASPTASACRARVGSRVAAG